MRYTHNRPPSTSSRVDIFARESVFEEFHSRDESFVSLGPSTVWARRSVRMSAGLLMF
jgi:hypothetical protein